MKAIRTIYLAWRKGRGGRRHIIGVLKRNATMGVRFSYLADALQKAQEEGFTPYIDFPDTKKIYTDNVLDIFSQRLIKAERSDIQKYLDFWEVKPDCQNDKLCLLAYTQGMLPTDNFEFLAEFHPVRGLCFVSEICGLSHSKIEPGTLCIGDQLSWQLEKNNPKDKYAVRVFKGDRAIGYIKLIHSRVFHRKLKSSLAVTVKSIDQNGSVNRVFVRISSEV